ncbi:MAG: TIGR04551 family protein [Deltaproteobacteria bacterium]|nr:TIGR04551 family protein [Deltaproteobacteria bacterium]
MLASARFSPCLVALIALSFPASAAAQRRRPAQPPQPAQPEEPAQPPAEEEPAEEEPAPEEPAGQEGETGAEGEEEGTMQLRAPMLEEGAPATEGEEEQQPGVSPEEARQRLLHPGGEGEGEHEAAEEEALGPWASKALPLFAMHGYFRTRFELFHQFHLGWGANPDLGLPPFPRPLESDLELCGEGGDPDSAECENNTLAGANLRLRMNPQINVSDEVQINAQLDLFDNLVLGSTPEGFDTRTDDPARPGQPAPISPWAPLRAFSSTQQPLDARNSLTDSIVLRRAWAQVRTDLGVLRFGRMGSEWGLGVLANGGDQLQSDYGDIADRLLFATRVAGITIAPIIDFPAEGPTSRFSYDHMGQPYDQSQLDDVNQYILVIARKLDEEDLRDRLQLGQLTLQGGLYLVYRDQILTTEYTEPMGFMSETPLIARRGAQAWIPDLWFQLQYKKLRLELEGVFIYGTIESIETGGGYSFGDYTVAQYGGVLQVDYRLMNDKLRLGFESGIASGDPDVEGMSPQNGLLVQLTDDKTISTFRFDRDYNVDLILWEEIFKAVAGAYYFRPNISYDFINSSLGQLFGARLDIVWSRAMWPVQTRGNHADLGVEIDAQLYYRSEDGVSLVDGFYAGIQYGILIPLAGMGTQDNESPSVDLASAQTLQAILAAVY